MTTKNRETTVSSLRESIAEAAARGGAQGVPHDLRRQVVEFTAAERRAGRTARSTATALGVHESTLCRWTRESGARERGAASPRKGDAFRAVRVATTPARAAIATAALSPVATLRVAHAPSGLVIDGLDVDALGRLLRSLS